MSIPQTDPTPATPEEIWKILRQVAESQKETDREIRKTQEQMNETDRRMQETDRRLRQAEDLFTTQWGRLIESLVEGDLAKLLQERGVEVDAILPGVKLRRDPKQREVDLLAVNGEEAVAVEVKTTLRPPDVDKFLELLQDLPSLMKTFVNGRLYGAVAYLREHEGTGRYAARRGLFVIRATGSSASIVNPPEFRPRRFHTPVP